MNVNHSVLDGGTNPDVLGNYLVVGNFLDPLLPYYVNASGQNPLD